MMNFNILAHRTEKAVTCQQCGSEFQAFISLPFCEACCEKQELERLRNADSDAQNARSKAFWSQVPPLYRRTDKARLSPLLAAAIADYEYGPMGIGFVGSAGAGKTRTAILILEKLMEQGLSTLYLPATELSAAAAGMFADDSATKARSRKKLEAARRAKALLIDDLGKGRLTDRAESELYDILEHRTSHELPTFWTSNSNAQVLRSMFSADRADALIRRIGKEFCTHIVV